MKPQPHNVPSTVKGQVAPYEKTCKHGVHYGGQDCFGCHPNHPALKTLRYLLSDSSVQGGNEVLNASGVESLNPASSGATQQKIQGEKPQPHNELPPAQDR